jgi:hypothetical protein
MSPISARSAEARLASHAGEAYDRLSLRFQNPINISRWSGKLQFGFYEPWSPWDCANATRWQTPPSGVSPFKLDWTNSTPLAGTRQNSAG